MIDTSTTNVAANKETTMDNSSTIEGNRLRIQNLIRRAKTENIIEYETNSEETNHREKNRRKSNTGVYGSKEKSTWNSSSKTKGEFMTESMRHMDPHNVIATLERFAKVDNEMAFEALQGLKNSEKDAPEPREKRRNSTHIMTRTRVTKEPCNLRSSV